MLRELEVNGRVGEELKTVAKREGEAILASGNGTRALSVLHISNYYAPHRGGIETQLRELVCWQSSRVPVEVVVANVVEKALPVTVTELMDGAQITRVACFGILASQAICPTLPWKLRGRNPSIIHLHLPNPLAAKAYLMSGCKGKLVISHHADTLGRRHLRRLVEPFVREAMLRAEVIIVPSKRYLDASQELTDFREKCRFIPYGINTDAFRTEPGAEVREIQARYGPRLILAVGRMVPYKGFEYLLHAMKNVNSNSKLLLIGNGPLRGQLESTIEQLEISNKVHLLGHVPDLVPYYKAATMLVLPSVSRAESFGLVQAEAMAAGIPVVNTDIESGVPEVSLHGVTGITVPPKDPSALAKAIRTLLDNPEVRAKYGQAAFMRASEEFSAQRMAEKTYDVYQSVL